MVRGLGVAGLVFLVLISVGESSEAGGWGPGQCGRVSVTVYEHAGFRGRQATYYGDVAWLPEGISSFRLHGRCTVTLFRGQNFSGRRQSFDREVSDLGRHSIGNDRIRSLVLSPWRAAPAPPPTKKIPPPPSKKIRPGQVILYQHSNYSGRSMRLSGNIADMRRTAIGNDALSSLRVQGAVVTLYEHINFQGRSQTFTSNVADLNRSRIGGDTTSSIRIRFTTNVQPGQGNLNYQQKGRSGTRKEGGDGR